MYVMGFGFCKKAVVASFPSLSLQKILLPGEEEEEEDEEEAEEGEVISTEMPMLPTIKEAEPAAEAPLPAEAKVVVPTECGGPVKGPNEVPLSS